MGRWCKRNLFNFFFCNCISNPVNDVRLFCRLMDSACSRSFTRNRQIRIITITIISFFPFSNLYRTRNFGIKEKEKIELVRFIY